MLRNHDIFDGLQSIPIIATSDVHDYVTQSESSELIYEPTQYGDNSVSILETKADPIVSMTAIPSTPPSPHRPGQPPMSPSSSSSNSSKPPAGRHSRGFSLSRKTPKLHQAAKDSDIATVRALLDGGININERDWSGKTALHRAASSGDAAVVALLLSWAELLDDGDDRVIIIVDAKASYNPNSLGIENCATGSVGQALYGDMIHGVTPLHRACGKGFVDIVRLLLESGADGEAITTCGRTPGSFAGEGGWFEVVELLSRGGVAG